MRCLIFVYYFLLLILLNTDLFLLLWVITDGLLLMGYYLYGALVLFVGNVMSEYTDINAFN